MCNGSYIVQVNVAGALGWQWEGSVSRVRTMFFSYSNALISDRIVYSHTCMAVFRRFNVALSPRRMFGHFGNMGLCRVVSVISLRRNIALTGARTRRICHTRITQLFSSRLRTVRKTKTLLSTVATPVYIMSGNPGGGVRRSVNGLGVLRCFPSGLFDNCSVRH